ncbi:15584_t:CDS:2, partial [Funneliformis caledonium]
GLANNICETYLFNKDVEQGKGSENIPAGFLTCSSHTTSV